MSINAQDLADTIKSELNGADNAPDANLSLGTAITNYFKDNTEFTFAWTAALTSPPYTPDPTVTASGKFIILNVICTPSGASEASTAMTLFASQIMAGFIGSIANITDGGFSTSPTPLSSAALISSLVINVSGGNQDDALLSLATQLVNWVKTLIPTTPCSGSHGAYVGIGVCTQVL